LTVGESRGTLPSSHRALPTSPRTLKMSAKRQQHLNDKLEDSLAACATKHPSIANALECLWRSVEHHVEYTCARMLGPTTEDNDDEPRRSVDMPRKSPVYKTLQTPVAVSPTDGTPRKRGRPRKDATPAEGKTPKTPVAVSPTDGTPRKRGRPRKDATPAEDNDDEPAAKRPRGRPPKSPVDKIKNRLVSPKSPGDKTPKKTVVASPTTQSPRRGRGRPRKDATPTKDSDDEPTAKPKRPVGKPTKTKTSAAVGKKKNSKSQGDLEVDKAVSKTAMQYAAFRKMMGI